MATPITPQPETPAEDEPTSVPKLVQTALQRLDTLLHTFTGQESGTTSGLIGNVALQMLLRLNLTAHRNADGTVSCFHLAAVLDGARSVPDASRRGIAVLDEAQRIAEALGHVVHYTDNPGPAEVSVLEQALATPLSPPPSMPTPESDLDEDQSVELSSRRAMAFAYLLDDMLEDGRDADLDPTDPRGWTQRMYACLAGLRGEIRTISSGLRHA